MGHASGDWNPCRSSLFGLSPCLLATHRPPPQQLLFQAASHPRAHTSPEIPAALWPQWGPEHEHRKGEGQHAHFTASQGGPWRGLSPHWAGRHRAHSAGDLAGASLSPTSSPGAVCFLHGGSDLGVLLGFLTPHSATRGLYTHRGCGPGHLSGSPFMASSPVLQRGQY